MHGPIVPHPDFSTLAAHPACNPACRVCHYKDLPYPEQLDRKNAWARSQLGRWHDRLRPIIPAPAPERLAYRSKTWLRASFEGGSPSFGMYRAIRVEGEWEKEFVSWDTCPLHALPIQRMIGRLREALPSSLAHSLVGVWVGSPHVVVVSREEDAAALAELDWAGILVEPFTHVWSHRNDQVGRKIFGHREIRPVHGEAAKDSVHPIKAFRQIAQTLLREARARAAEALLRDRPDLVVDLYCGTGDLSLLLPRETGWLGIEMSRDAVHHANSLRADGPADHVAFVGAVEQRLRDPRVLERIRGPYSLYVNPPRSGLGEEARRELLSVMRGQAPQRVAYLSCSASSLRRDLEAFEGRGYRVESLQPFDFFPQTEHFETMAMLGA